MKKFNYKTGFGITIMIIVVGFVMQANAATTYTLLAPIPCIESTDTSGGTTNGTKTVTCDKNLSTVEKVTAKQYIQYAMNLLIALSAVAAVLMIVIGGLQYMTTTSPGSKTEGLGRVKNAVLGLILVLCSYLILRTIDPRLVNITDTIVPKIVETKK